MSELALMQETLSGALGRMPSADELAAAMGVDRATVEASQLDAARSVTPLTDVIADMVAATAQTPEESLLAAEHEDFLGSAVAALPEKMRYIVEQIYYRDRSVKELADELGSSHSAVSQQRSEAMRLLRDGLELHYLETADAQSTPHSRVSASRRGDYLAELGTRTYGGATRARLGVGDQPHRAGVPAVG